MKKIKQLAAAAVLAVGVGAVVLPAPAQAINVFEQCDTNRSSEVCKAQNDDEATSMIETVVNTMIFLLGAIAVIMIVIGGLRYTVSGGDASGTKAARDTVLYAAVGLVVAILAYAIVNFVLGAFD